MELHYNNNTMLCNNLFILFDVQYSMYSVNNNVVDNIFIIVAHLYLYVRRLRVLESLRFCWCFIFTTTVVTTLGITSSLSIFRGGH